MSAKNTLASACAFAALALACQPVGMPLKTGLRVTSIDYEERCAREREEESPHRHTDFRGDALLDVVPLLDSSGVSAIAGNGYAPEAVADGCTAKLTIEFADQPPRHFDVHDCFEPHVCTFLDRMDRAGLLKRSAAATCNPARACVLVADGQAL